MKYTRALHYCTGRENRSSTDSVFNFEWPLHLKAKTGRDNRFRSARINSYFSLLYIRCNPMWENYEGNIHLLRHIFILYLSPCAYARYNINLDKKHIGKTQPNLYWNDKMESKKEKKFTSCNTVTLRLLIKMTRRSKKSTEPDLNQRPRDIWFLTWSTVSRSTNWAIGGYYLAVQLFIIYSWLRDHISFCSSEIVNNIYWQLFHVGSEGD